LAAVLLTVLAAVFITMPSAHAAEGGYTNYLPGSYGDFGVAVAPDPGFYLRSDLYYYAADASRERIVQYGKLRADLDLDTGFFMLTGLKVLDREVLGGRYAFGAALPFAYTDISGSIVLEPLATSFDADRAAIGDMAIIPASFFWNFGNFHINAFESITVPVGSYDQNRDVNTGLNYWSFDTTFAATYLHPERGHEISAAIGYIFNTENGDTDYKTGQEFHLDYMLNQFFSETFALGLQGFYYKQATGDSGSGAILGDFKGEAAGIGPAVMWITKIKNADLVINLKWINEYHAESRLEGDHLFLNFTLAF
jgi:hypothetical protein